MTRLTVRVDNLRFRKGECVSLAGQAAILGKRLSFLHKKDSRPGIIDGPRQPLKITVRLAGEKSFSKKIEQNIDFSCEIDDHNIGNCVMELALTLEQRVRVGADGYEEKCFLKRSLGLALYTDLLADPKNIGKYSPKAKKINLTNPNSSYIIAESHSAKEDVFKLLEVLDNQKHSEASLKKTIKVFLEQMETYAKYMAD